MKKTAKILLAVICLITLALLIYGIVCAAGNTVTLPAPEDTKFGKELETIGMMENTWDEAVPQTEIYNLIREHFTAPLPEGKTDKKAIVIGYDGCRADTLTLLGTYERSAVELLLREGGHAVFSYCGGKNYPEMNTQKTSTAPGWCSMLTGVTAEKHGVYKNYQPKAVEPKTLFISLEEDGLIDNSAFYVSWKGHFSKKKATYVNELRYIEDNSLNSVFLKADDDDGTEANVLADLEREDCSDFIFLTLEYTDHNGHATGFSLKNSDYTNGFLDAESAGMSFIEAIKSRATYDTEDWLILITTDHGGIDKNHGGSSFEERITFIVSNKDIL